MTINKKPYDYIKYAGYFLLPVMIALYLTYPLLKGDYFFANPEYHILKPFMKNFIEILQNFELPMWDEYVGCGRPAVIFGRYPIMLNTPFYMIFGYSDFTYYVARFIDISILFLIFIYSCRYLKLSYMYALIGSLVYFSVNFVAKFTIWEVIGNLYTIYPILLVLIINLVSENGKSQWKSKKNIVVFSLLYILWLSGGYLTFWFMPLVMLSVVYWFSVYVFHFKSLSLKSIKRFIGFYFILFIVPLIAVLYQYYFVYDVIINSNRLQKGYIVSPFELNVWKHLAASFLSSSYFWMGLFLTIIYSVLKVINKKYRFLEGVSIKGTNWRLFLVLLFGFIFVLTVSKYQFASNSDFFIDYISILNSTVFRMALLIYICIQFLMRRSSHWVYLKISDLVVFIIYISLLSYYFYSPGNIIGENNIGYDYHLFRELSVFFQIVFVLAILFSIGDYKQNKIVKIIILSCVVHYLLRSHFTIPLMRFTGIVWYATRDGTIFSLFYAVLFMYGLRNMMFCLSKLFSSFHIERSSYIANYIKYGFLTFLVILLVSDSYNTFLKGKSHRFIYPKNIELTKTPWEKTFQHANTEILASVQRKFLELDEKTDHFYRVFSPENSYLSVAGGMQGHKIHEAVIYDSAISKQLHDFYQNTILEKDMLYELKDLIPYFLFTRHVHRGLGLSHKEIPYGGGGFFMSNSTTDIEYIKNQNIEFLWDLMQVKYIHIGVAFAEALGGFTTRKEYRLVAEFPKLDTSKIYEIIKRKSYSKIAILPLNPGEYFDEVVWELNSDNIDILKKLYSRLVFLDNETEDYNLLKSRNNHNKKYYEIESNKRAVLINFESWNHSWELQINKEEKKLEKAFQIFSAIKLQPGLNRIELRYNLKYFKTLFFVSIFVIFLYIAILVKFQYPGIYLKIAKKVRIR
jgi:hypothetical protein